MAAAPGESPPGKREIRGVVVDPADYLRDQPDAAAFARRLIDQLDRNDVNTLYLNAYNVEYGAYYRTDYEHNHESPYGKQDFLRHVLDEAHERRIAVYAAVYDHQHRGAWEENPSWRAKERDGDDYSPRGTDVQHFLSVANPEATRWWSGFLTDLLESYPDLDGVELREPIVNWWGADADYSPAANGAFRSAHPKASLGGKEWIAFRRQLLTRFLQREIELIHGRGLSVHLTTVASALRDGQLMSAAEQARETGFDLEAILKTDDRTLLPDAVKVELIWQQWAAVYGYVTFTPEWTGDALEAFLGQVDGRVPVIPHVELTDFGSRPLTVDEFRRSLEPASMDGVVGVDVYSAALADSKRAWPALRSHFRGERRDAATDAVHRVLVLYDEAEGELALIRATHVVNLLGHFDVSWRLQPVEEYAAGDVDAHDSVVYEGSVFGNAPKAFLTDIAQYRGNTIWIGRNLFQLEELLDGTKRALPIAQDTQDADEIVAPLRFKGETIASRGDIIDTDVAEGGRVVASVRRNGRWQPYVINSEKFWYVAGSPFQYLDEVNGRYLAFSDLLHDALQISSSQPRRAFVRIEDVNPMTDPQAVRKLADTFARRDASFMIAFFPFYIHPEKKIDTTLSEHPKMVEALKYAVDRGATIVLHGSTHQRKGGISGIDWEFWDPDTVSGVSEDGPEYVETKVTAALEEMWANDLHPLAWETPHYGATPFDYSAFATHFSTFVERRTIGVWKGSDYQQPMPYVIESDVYGGRVIPENLGYVRDAGDVDRITAGAKAMRVVRGAVAGAFIHPTVSPDVVDEILEAYDEAGYRSLDLAREPNTVRTTTHVETTSLDPVEIPVPRGARIEERVLNRNGNERSSEARTVTSYMRAKRILDPSEPGDILVLAVDPRPRLGGGFAGAARWMGAHVDDAVIAVGSVSILLLLLVYAHLKVAGPVPALIPARAPIYRRSASGARAGAGHLSAIQRHERVAIGSLFVLGTVATALMRELFTDEGTSP